MSNNDDLSRLIVSEAAQLASMVLDFIGKRQHLHTATMTTIAYATQIIIHHFAKECDVDYNAMSDTYRDFLKQVQEDVLNMANQSDPNVN